ncbi:MAG: 2-hydroxyacid dehydrogenase [Deltaproteobacteria bacterium]|nr:2-hydroxyacid dehydrogenase [Deltaproteobacteria bacterium]
MKLLYCGSGWGPIVDMIRVELPDGCALETWDREKPQTEAARDADVILPSNGGCSAEVISAASKLRLIQQPAAGFDGIDLEAAGAQGIPVCNAPGTNHVAVAEACLLLMLSLARKVNQARDSFRRAQIGVPLGFELDGKSLGIVGYGRSGRALAERARALGMSVEWVSRSQSSTTWDQLFAASDVISIHAPLTTNTVGLIGAQELSRMKPGALLINAARGRLLDRQAAAQALERGQLGGLGLDTYWEEPWQADDPLFCRPDVVTLPHIAGSTRESFARITTIVCENVRRLQRGAALLHLLNEV